MLKRVIEGWNAAPGAPRGWDPHRDGDCGALPIRVTPPSALSRPLEKASGVQYCESAWEPTPEELRLLNEGHSLILRVAGWQVPVALYVDPGKPRATKCPQCHSTDGVMDGGCKQCGWGG